MGRPPIPARKRELRARSLGEQVEQHMERQGKQYGRAGLDAALQVVRHQFGVAQRTAYDLWKEHGNWKARREQEIVDSMIDAQSIRLSGGTCWKPHRPCEAALVRSRP